MKKLLTFFSVCFVLLLSAQKSSYQLSSHILDIGKGQPAPGVQIQLEKMNETSKTWTVVDRRATDKNGRVGDFLPSTADNAGIYKLTFFTQPYFQQQKTDSFYPFIEVIFKIADEAHYHVAITVSPYGYSTYRGN